MAGVIPKTRYLLTRTEIVQRDFESLLEIARYLGIRIDDEGWVHFLGEKQGPNYTLVPDRNGWEKPAALRDWVRCYLPPEYRIYRYLEGM